MRVFALLYLCLLSACGCSEASNVAAVSGLVTMDGKPLPNVVVRFSPDGSNRNPGSGSYATTGPDGRYELRQVDPDRPGAVIGMHRVAIATNFPESAYANGEPNDPIPKRYNERTQLTFEVPAGGTTAADFALDSKR